VTRDGSGSIPGVDRVGLGARSRVFTNPCDLRVCIRYGNAACAAEHPERRIWINPEGVEYACPEKPRPSDSRPTVNSNGLPGSQSLLDLHNQSREFDKVAWHAAIRNRK
jgi:hypothetical protein